MTWQYLRGQPGMGLEESWLRRIGTAPAIALRRDSVDDRWVAHILELTGISARSVYSPAVLTVVEAQSAAMAAARDAGWRE